MQNTAFRRGAVAASAVSLALLLSACGGEDKKDESKGSNGAKNDTKKSAPAKTQAELDKLAIVSADVKGGAKHEVKPALASDIKDAAGAKSDKSECATLNKVMAGGAPGESAASVSRRVTTGMEPPKTGTPEEQAAASMDALKNMSMSMLTLASYEGDGATKAVADLKKSAEACGAGFTSTIKSDKTKVTKVAPATYAGGDEALAYTVSVDAEGESMQAPVVVVRKGNEVFSIFSFNLSGKSEQPKAVIDAQLKKLG
ncbi:hypothetical protein ABZ714_17740 [Streptomyces sp. NPDC006798]|uniref:hypothetical protein n=1 Tax=Streptomyces sp. NPDC006798 TaxID=3155462 RepID=UPI0033E20B75